MTEHELLHTPAHMSRSGDLYLALCEERRWNKQMTEAQERDFIIQYTKDRLPPMRPIIGRDPGDEQPEKPTTKQPCQE